MSTTQTENLACGHGEQEHNGLKSVHSRFVFVNDVTLISDMHGNYIVSLFAIQLAKDVSCTKLTMTFSAKRFWHFAILTFFLVPKICLQHFNLKVSTTTTLRTVYSLDVGDVA